MNTSVFCIHILGSITVSWIHEHLCILYLYFRKYHSILDTWMPLYSVTIFWEVSLYPGYMNTSLFCIHILGSITVSWIHEHLCILYHILGSITVSWIHEYPCIQHYGIKLCPFVQVKMGKWVNYIKGGGIDERHFIHWGSENNGIIIFSSL